MCMYTGKVLGGKHDPDLGCCDGMNETLISGDLNNGLPLEWDTCWTACLIKYPDTLVAINGPGTVFHHD